MNKEQMLLTLIMEECSEIAQAASKCLRFGSQKVFPGREIDNLENMKSEITDLRAVVFMLEDELDVRLMNGDVRPKMRRKEVMMDISREQGILV